MPDEEEPDSKKVVSVKFTRKMLTELHRETNRTGHSRTALLRIAWQEYLERRNPKKPNT